MKSTRYGRAAWLGAWLAGMLSLPAATFTVTHTNDSGPGSLRQAMTDANNQPGPHQIGFAIPGAGPHRLAPLSPLPQINETLTLDGTTQPGYTGQPLIVLDGVQAGNAYGLLVLADDCVIRGLVIHRFSRDGIRLENVSRCVIQGNYIGTDATGTVAAGMGENGIGISGGSGHLIGGLTPAERNLISACTENGIILSGAVGGRHRLRGNYIGTDVTGMAALGNRQSGVVLAASTQNEIGGLEAGAGNLISGNQQSGVYLLGPGADANLLWGNRIGVNATGTARLPNRQDGVTLFQAAGNVLGDCRPAGANLIAGNQEAGIYVGGSGSVSNVITGNRIGVNAAGTAALSNQWGVAIENAPRNIIGGSTPGAGNLISGNLVAGITVQGLTAAQNRVEGNLIGTDATGRSAVPNNGPGIFLNAPSNSIGGARLGAGNVISGNQTVGISLINPLSAGNVIQGNFIGLAVDGLTPLGNQFHGIEIQLDASYNRIGGTGPGEGNRIGYARMADYDGVRIHDYGVGNVIRGNAIFGQSGLPIDLGPNGPTPNDAGDGDDGPNLLQNYPVLTLATGRFALVLSGQLASRPGQSYTLDFYLTTASNQFWLGEASVVTDAAGLAPFTVRFTNTWAATGTVSATATDAAGNTSEYSPGITLAAPPWVDSDGDGLPDDYELAFGLNPLSAADALQDADGDGASNRQEFLAGTHPRRAASGVRFTALYASPCGGRILEWSSGNNGLWVLEGAAQVNGPWQTLLPAAPALGLPMRWVDTAPSERRFFRLRLP
ncbi:MAG: hypothetical protein N3J91_04100 [Verrucomicrobiae bacterium]|nr:hypothetical protein [Verrucomicrobiae bacterium]